MKILILRPWKWFRILGASCEFTAMQTEETFFKITTKLQNVTADCNMCYAFESAMAMYS